MIVGLSHERVSQTFNKWIEILDALEVEYVVSKLSPELANDKAIRTFRNAQYHCLCRNTTLGQYVDVIEQGADVLLIPSREKSGDILVCDSVRNVPMEIANVFGDKVKIINPIISENIEEKQQTLYQLAKKLGKIEKADKLKTIWNENFSRNNCFVKEMNENTTILLVGRIDHYLDYTDKESLLMNKLVNSLKVNILTPSMIENKRNYLIRDNFHKIGCMENHFWDSKNIINAIYNGYQQFDGILFVHDANCMVSIDEIDYIISKIRKLNIPYYVLSFNNGVMASVETAIEAFVDMLDLRNIGSRT